MLKTSCSWVRNDLYPDLLQNPSLTPPTHSTYLQNLIFLKSSSDILRTNKHTSLAEWASRFLYEYKPDQGPYEYFDLTDSSLCRLFFNYISKLHQSEFISSCQGLSRDKIHQLNAFHLHYIFTVWLLHYCWHRDSCGVAFSSAAGSVVLLFKLYSF